MFPIVVFFSPFGGCVIFATKSSASPENAIPVGFTISDSVFEIRTLVPASSNFSTLVAVLFLKFNSTVPSCVIVAISEASSSSNLPFLLKSIQERT